MSLGGTIRSALGALMLADGRRAWAVVLLAGGGVSMTLYAAAAMWLLRDHALFVLYLGLFAHLAILVAITGFAGLLVKRTIKAGDGARMLEISDQADPAGATAVDTVRAAAAGAAAGAVAASTPQS